MGPDTSVAPDASGTNAFLRLPPQAVPGLGDTVFIIGYPTPDLLGTDPKYTNGTVSALSGLRGDASFLQISVPIQPGSSGGPLGNDEGDVVGVVVATADAPTFMEAADSIPQNINWAVKSVFASVSSSRHRQTSHRLLMRTSPPLSVSPPHPAWCA